ncbi:MAG: DUF523 domain-containing protein [Clostridiales bacterium]|nr:DUF523 domain-containing protein [Clostridiales bacterium]
MKIIISACLLGEKCKYDSTDNYNASAVKLGEAFELVPVCPELFGALPVPRMPCEIKNGRVVAENGADFTAEYKSGAEKTLYIAQECNACCAVLKEKSPSCGFGKIYDGTFSRTLADGNGVAAALLWENGIKIFGESKIDKLLDEML